MIYGYKRVSTKKQAKDGNSLEAQEKALIENGATKIYGDAFTGTKTDRPELTKLISIVQPGDTIVVTKLDRLGRSLSKTTELITELIDKGTYKRIVDDFIMGNELYFGTFIDGSEDTIENYVEVEDTFSDSILIDNMPMEFNTNW